MDFRSYRRHSEAWQENKILLLDPDEAIQMLYREELNEEGYEVIPVNETNQVIKYIETYEPTLLIMEAGLYGRNGLQVLQDIRAAHPELPVIVCTADPSFKTEPITSMADDVVLKGMSMTALKQSVHNILAFKRLIKGTDKTSPNKPDGPLSHATDSNIYAHDDNGPSRARFSSRTKESPNAHIKKENLT